MLELRDYQAKAHELLRQGFLDEHGRQLAVMPTGSGKTELAAALALAAQERGGKMIFIVDRLTLCTQAAERFRKYGMQVGVMQGENTEYSGEDDVLVATIQTLWARMKKNPLSLEGTLIIVDEAHVLFQGHRKIFERMNKTPVIGLTATPHHRELGKWYTNMVAPITIAELIKRGLLVKPRIFQPDSQVDTTGVKTLAADFNQKQLGQRARVITADVVSNWLRRGENRPTLVFAVNVAHAEELSHEFEQAGVPSAWIYHGTELEDRAEIFRRFREGEIKVLCSVTALTTGFDEPSASCLIVARPTRSEALHIQMDGRGLRPNEGKKDCLIFDHAGSHHRHGLPQDYEPPTLEEIEQRTAAKREDKDRKPSTCDECDAVMRARQRTCDECGAERELLSMVIVQDGKLVETDGALPAEVLESSEYKTQWLSEAKGYGEAKRYSPQFGAKMFSIKFGKYPSGFKIWDRNVKARECGPEVGRWIRNEFKRKKIASNAVAKKLTANLPVFNPASKRHVPGCGHGTEDYFSGTGQHYAQVRCRNCGHFKRWAGADEVIKAIGKPAA